MKPLPFLFVCALCSWLALGQREVCPTEPTCLGCQSRSRITCSSGGLTSFPNLPPDLKPDVEELTLRNNGLTGVRVEDLVNYTSLETLIISFNNISDIEPGSFDDTGALTRIDLTSNRITELPDGLFANTQLLSLLASDNLIDEVSAATFTGLDVFSTINLDGNRIETIPNGTFSSIGRIDQLTLLNNPLVCDCRLWWLREFLDPSSPSRPLTSSVGACTVPSLNNTNAQFSTLSADDFECVCSPSCVNGTCNTDTGVCECNDGYIGNACSTVCPSGTYGADCSQNCTCVPEQESSPCDHVDGTCHCLPGYEGSSCERECQEGFYGQDCVGVCQCQNEASCDFGTGSCDCGAGWMGQFCNMSCSNGTYGPNCLESCMCTPEHESSPCDVMNGTCFCLPDYTGSTCDVLICMDGYYGSDCQQNCTCVEQHQRRPCDQMTGECLCLPDYVGRNCEQLRNQTTTSATTETTESMPNRTAVIAGAVVGSVLGTLVVIAVFVVLATVLCLVLKKHKTRKQSLRISPSQQFAENDKKLQTDINFKPSAPPPQYEDIQTSETYTETKLITDTEKAPLTEVETS